MRTRVVTSLMAMFLLLAVSNSALACGRERWPIKTGTDKDAERVILKAEPANIALLTSIGAPVNPNIRNDTRYAPIELKTFEITGTLIVVKRETDQDYHLVIRDNRGRTMIVEVPDSSCAQGSRFLDQIQQVRGAIDQHFGPIHRKLQPNVVVTVIGVAFFDKIHGQEGVAPNGIELHPLLAIVFH